MFSLTWKFHCNETNQIAGIGTAAGSSLAYLHNDLIWQKWNSSPVVGQKQFIYDLSFDKEIDNLIIYNHNFGIRASVKLRLMDSNSNIVFDETWISGQLGIGFGLASFGLNGFGGLSSTNLEINPYNVFYKFFDKKVARFVEITVDNTVDSLSIGFMSVGQAFSPKICSIDALVVQYETSSTQNISVEGSISGKPSISRRNFNLKATLFDYIDTMEYVQLIINRNTSKMVFFTAVHSTTNASSNALILSQVSTAMCYINKNNYPSYEIGHGNTSTINLSLLESI